MWNQTAVLELKTGFTIPLVRMSNTMIHGGTHADIDELMEDVQYGVYACEPRGAAKSTPVVVRSSSRPRKPGSSKTAN